MLRFYEGAFAERDKEESADLAAEYIRNFTQKEPIPGITYEYGLVQRFVPGDHAGRSQQGGEGLGRREPRRAGERARRRRASRCRTATKLAAVIKSAAERDIKPYVDVAASQSLLDRPPQAGHRREDDDAGMPSASRNGSCRTASGWS